MVLQGFFSAVALRPARQACTVAVQQLQYPHKNREIQSSTRAMSMTSRATFAIVWPRSIASLRIA